MDVYVTIQGDTWDSLAYELYGDEKYMQLLIEANWSLLDILVFPSGVEINVPEIPDETDEDAPFWRQDDEDEDEDYYSSVEEVEDE
jgi:phage tail protein X